MTTKTSGLRFWHIVACMQLSYVTLRISAADTLRSWQSFCCWKAFSYFRGAETFIPLCSRALYFEPFESIPHWACYFFMANFNNILLSTYKSPMCPSCRCSCYKLFSPPTVPPVNKFIYSNPFSLHPQFLSYKATKIAVGSVSSLAVTHSVTSTELSAGTDI
jgi:hypothetical protein